MNIRTKAVATSAMALAAAFVAPTMASAQVAGIAEADPTVAIFRSKGLSDGYQKIDAAFASNTQQIMQKRKEMNDINAQLDTNKDKNLTQAELDAAVKANNPLLKQLEAKENEIAQLQQPSTLASLFVVESILQQYNKAQDAVIKAKKINFIFTPDSFVYSPPAADVTPAIAAELDKLIPTVNITPPANWRAQQETAAVYQRIQQMAVAAARYQAAIAAQQQQQAAPATGAQPAPAQPAPRPAEDR